MEQRTDGALDNLSDAQLMLRVREGDPGCAVPLCRRYGRALYNYFLHLTGDRATSQDLVQDTFLRLLQYRSGYRGSGPFRVWLFRLARSAAGRHFRGNQAVWVNLDDVVDPPRAPGQSPADAIERRQAAQRLWRLLDQLPRKQREVVVLRCFQEMSYSDIAKVRGSTAGAARVLFHRALKALAHAYLERTVP